MEELVRVRCKSLYEMHNEKKRYAVVDLRRDQGGLLISFNIKNLIYRYIAIGCTASETSLTADFLESVHSIAVLYFRNHQIQS